jgi:hypothetical protein
MSVVDLTSGVSYATLSDAIAGSSANDVIQISAGSYVENFPNITHNLTIEAAGGVAYLSNPQPDPPNGRAVINVPGNLDVSLTLVGLDISGAVDDASNPPSGGGANGAGILFETGNGALDVVNCHIHNNEDGILTGDANSFSLSGMTVTITNTEIDHNGVDTSNIRYGFDHNVYAGVLTQLTVSNSYIHDALGGHEIKSNALNTIIMDSRILDGPTAGTSYSVDLPSGHVATIENNVIEKGPNAQNDAFIHYGGDVPTVPPDSSLTITGNTVVDDKASNQGPFVFDGAVFTSGGPIVVPTISANTFYGPGPDNLLAGPNFEDGQPGAPYAPFNIFLPITDAPPADTSAFSIQGTTTVDGSTGSRTLFLDTVPGSGISSKLFLINNGNGTNTIDIITNATSSSAVEGDVLSLLGSSTVASTVNAGGSAVSGTVAAGVQQAEVIAFISGSANTVINGGAANVILFGAGALGSATLFGGSGTDIDAGAGGLIEAGTGGGSLLFASFTNATTLVGGGNNDVLATLAEGQVMQAGVGSETLASFNQGAVYCGLGVTSLGQGPTIGSATTTMIGEIGGNRFDLGEGATQVQAWNRGTNTYQESVAVGAASNTATITGFDVGSDTVSLLNPLGGAYATVPGTVANAGQISVNFSGGNTTLAFGDGTTWTIVGAVLTGSNFH